MAGLQQGDADRAGLAEDAEGTPGGQHRGERGVQRVLRVGGDQAEGVGADHPHAGRPGLADQGALAVAALGAGLGVAGGDHHQSLDAVRTALGDRLGHGGGGHRDHREVDRAGDLQDRAVHREAVELGAGRGVAVHRVDRAVGRGEAGEQVAQQGPADGLRGAGGADHGDRARSEQPLHGAGLGAVLAGPHDGERGGGGFEVELQVDHAVGEAAALDVAGVGEDLHHLAVLRQHLGLEAADAAFLGDRGDVLQQGGGDAPALVGVLDQEGDLGVGAGLGGAAVGVDPVVADGGDEAVADDDGEADPVDEVVVGEAPDVLVGEPGVGREEAEVLGLVRHLFVELDQTARVRRGDRADPGRAAVAQQDVGLPVLGVVRAGRAVVPADRRPGGRRVLLGAR